LIDFPHFSNFEETKKNTMASSRSSRGGRFRGSVRLFALFLLISIFFSVMIDQAEGE
jgi:hypothetical protein